MNPHPIMNQEETQASQLKLQCFQSSLSPPPVIVPADHVQRSDCIQSFRRLLVIKVARMDNPITAFYDFQHIRPQYSMRV